MKAEMTIREQHDALQELVQSKGYAMMIEMLEQGEKSAQLSIVKAPDAHQMAKLAGKLDMIAFLKNWAQGNLYNLRGFLEAEKAGKLLQKESQ